jgi:hypothetical protein
MNYDKIYEFRFGGISKTARKSVWDVLAPYLFERLGRPKRILDPAAGSCEFLNAVKTDEKWAIDRSKQTLLASDPSNKVIISDIQKAKLPREFFDGIFISNFLEHLSNPEEISSFLTQMHASLSVGGRILIMGPNFKYCAREYFDCADHTVILTEVSLSEQLFAAGFTLNAVVPRFLPYSFRGRLPKWKFMVKLYLALPWAWRFVGKQFLIVAEKQKATGKSLKRAA